MKKMCKKYVYSLLWMFCFFSSAGYAFDLQVYQVGVAMPDYDFRSTSAYCVATTASAVTTCGVPCNTSDVAHSGSSISNKQVQQAYVPFGRTRYRSNLYKVSATEAYQVAQFQVNALYTPIPMRSSGLDDGDEEEGEGNGTVDENNTEDLKPYAHVGDIPWGVMLLLAGLLLYTKQRKTHQTRSKSIADMNTLSKPLSILLLCLLIAPAAKAEGYTLTRLWKNTTGQSLTPLSQVGDIDNTTPGTCGAFIVDTAGMLYIDDNSTSPQRMIRLLPNGDPHPKGNIEGCDDTYKYLWCEYDPKQHTVYWFLRNQDRDAANAKEDMVWVNYRNITQYEDATKNDKVHGLANVYTSTAQVALSPDQYLWTASWSEANSCTIRRLHITNQSDVDKLLEQTQECTFTELPLSSKASGSLVYIAPIDSIHALVVDRSNATYYCTLSQTIQSLQSINLVEDDGNSTYCHSTLGGTVFKMGEKYYYTAGRYSEEGNNYQGAFTVYKFNDATPSDNITRTYYTKDIGLTENPNTATCTVTFRTVVKHDDTYGNYALIYQFVPGHGVACYYYTERADKDEHRTVNIRVTNGTATCNEAPVTQTKVRYFAKFQEAGETLTIIWSDENDAKQTQTIVASPQQKAGYKAVFKGWNIPKEGYVTGDCEVSGEYTYELEADAGEVDFVDRLVTWGKISSDTAITFDLNGFYYMSDAKKVYPSNSDTRTWKINHTDVPIQETANLDPVTRKNDKTFTITIPKGAVLPTDDYAYIELYHNETLVGGHAFPVPVIDNQPEAGRDLYVHGALEISGNQTAKNIYIEPTASLTITTDANLTVTDTLYIRSRGTQVGQLLNNGTLALGAGKLVYTHQMARKDVAEPLAMPFSCTLPKTAGGVAYVALKTRLQAETGKESGNHVVIKKYNGATRANSWDGTAAALWEKQSGADITLKATEGYEIVSGSAYYREYLFPLTYDKKATTTTATLTAYKADNTAPHNIGWNFLCTPYTSNYSQSITLDPSDQKYAFIVRYADDGTFITSISMGGLNIPPFTPFYVQVNGTGENNQTVVLTYDAIGVPVQLRARVQAEETPTSWASITLSDGNAADQTTLIICNDHQDGYEVGADCEKMLGTTEVRPQVYTMAVDGLRAFNALPEATAATPVAVGYIAPKAAELTFSLSEDFPLEKIEHLYLSDYETGTVTDLISNHYTFFTTAGTFHERFTLYVTYRNEVSTGVNTENQNATLPRKVVKNGQLYIIVQGRVLDTTGREVSYFE